MNNPALCLSCNQSEQDMPLVTLQYRGRPAWICSQCLPLLIHHPQELIGKLEGAEKIEPAAHRD